MGHAVGPGGSRSTGRGRVSFNPHLGPLPVRWEMVFCCENARSRTLRCLPGSTFMKKAANMTPDGNARPRSLAREHQRIEWFVTAAILVRAFYHHPRLRSDDGMEGCSKAIVRIWSRTSGSDSSTSSFAKRTTRYPAALSRASGPYLGRAANRALGHRSR